MNVEPYWRLSIVVTVAAYVSLTAFPPQSATAHSVPSEQTADQATVTCILTQFRTVAYDSLTRLPSTHKARAAHLHFIRQGSHEDKQNSGLERSGTDSGHNNQVASAIAVFDQIQHEPPPRHAQAMDDFTVTAYAVSFHSTGKSPNSPGFGITYSGTRATVARTIAVDPHVIPIGSLVYIEGIGWRLAEDIGGAVKGRHIDLLLPSDAAAIRFGVKRHVRVYVVP